MVVAFLPRLLVAVIMFFAFFIGYRVVRRPLELMLRHAGMHERLVTLLVHSILRVTFVVFGLVMAASQLGINVAAALAGIGVAGLAVGFAAQDSISNTIAGFLIFWDKPFQVGDFVSVSGEYGRVVDVTLRSTRIRTNQNTYVVIPNKNIIDEVLVNHSKHGETRVDVPVGIAYKEDILSARDVILKALADLPRLATKPSPDVVVSELGDSSVNLLVRAWIDDAADEQPVTFAVIEACKIALDAAGIEIPYPHLQLFVEDVEDRAVKQLARVTGAGG